MRDKDTERNTRLLFLRCSFFTTSSSPLSPPKTFTQSNTIRTKGERDEWTRLWKKTKGRKDIELALSKLYSILTKYMKYIKKQIPIAIIQIIIISSGLSSSSSSSSTLEDFSRRRLNTVSLPRGSASSKRRGWNGNCRKTTGGATKIRIRKKSNPPHWGSYNNTHTEVQLGGSSSGYDIVNQSLSLSVRGTCFSMLALSSYREAISQPVSRFLVFFFCFSVFVCSRVRNCVGCIPSSVVTG